MGTWGPAIFSDDTAGDVRDAYRLRVADGMDGVAATDEMVREWLHDQGEDDQGEDDPDALVFWLALAATQSKAGRLEDRVRDMALEIIDSGSDLERWREEGQGKQRQKHLEKLRRQLTGPQPAPKRIRVKRFHTPDFKDGDYVAYQLSNDDYVIIFFERIVKDDGCFISVLDWKGKELPSADRIRELPKKTLDRSHSATAISLYTMEKKGIPHDRLTVLDVPDDKRDRPGDAEIIWWWENLEYFVLDHFNWDKPKKPFWPETLPPLSQSDAEGIVEAFRQHCGHEQFERFVQELNHRGRHTGRLRFWQEQLWTAFAESFGGNLPQGPAEIAAVLDLSRAT